MIISADQLQMPARGEAFSDPRAEGMVATHELKCWPEFFGAIAEGRKRHDMRRSRDRDFQVGDRLRLREFDPVSQAYTGREQTVIITYITSAERRCALSEEALHPDFCVLSIAPPSGD